MLLQDKPLIVNSHCFDLVDQSDENIKRHRITNGTMRVVDISKSKSTGNVIPWFDYESVRRLVLL